MMLKVNDSYLDFDDSPQVERQIKLFEDIDTSDGDYSYSFDLQPTSNNIRTLSAPFADNILKPSYTKIPAQLLTDEGLQLYDGYLRIEQINPLISVSFFAGNNNWFGLLAAPISDIDFSEFDQEQNTGSIVAGFSATSGVAFPLVDHGPLITRSYKNLKIEDFVPGIYVKTVFKKIFQSHSIKIQGDLVTDPLYDHAITIKSSKSQTEIEAASSYAGQTSTQARPSELVYYKMLFDTDSDYPFFDGSLDALDLAGSRYVVPYKMTAEIEITYKPAIDDSSYSNRIYLYINGAWSYTDIGLSVGGLTNSATVGGDLVAMKRTLSFDLGDVLEVYTQWQQSGGTTQNDVLSGTFKITPKFIYSVFGNSLLPKWTQAKYVSNILRMLNVLPSYEPKTKTLTLNYFNKIKDTVSIDLSEHIASTIVDYKDFISSYAKRNILSYNQVDFDDIRQYNVRNFLEYGAGTIESNNEFLDESIDLIQSDFSSPIDYLNQVFDMSISRTNLLTIEQGESYDIRSVQDVSGSAQFTLLVADIFIGDLIRVTESTNPNYNGDWIVTAKTAPHLSGGDQCIDIEVEGLPFDSNSTGRITSINIKNNETEDVFLLWNCPLTFLTDFTNRGPFRFETGNMLFTAMAYFSLLNTGRTINSKFKQSLSFGSVEKPQFYQRTIIDTYWGLFGGILNDPVKLISQANIPYNIFLKLDFLRQITIKTLETSNQYYLNKITGYDNEERQCTCELIKLSGPGRAISTPIIPIDPGLSPQFVQNANAVFVTGSAATLTFTFSSNLATDTDVWIYTSADTKLGFPAGGATVNQGIIATFVSINGASNNWGIMWNMRGFPGSNNILTISFTVGNRYSNITGVAYETRHGLWIGNAFDSISAGARTSAVLSGGTNTGVSSALIVGAGFVGVPGFTTTSDPPGVALEVMGNNALQSVYGGFIVPAGVSQNTMQIDWVNSLQAWGYCIELVYT